MDGTYSVSLAVLENDVGKNLATWTGDARQSYTTCKARWDQAASQIPTTLVATRATLESIAEQYDAAEKAAIDTFFGGIH
jgi:WXG100 family type VII secretion target